jgi:hypothetical protein
MNKKSRHLTHVPTTPMVLNDNPYEGNDRLTRTEADVLWEYAKLAENMRQVRALKMICRG